MEEECGGSSRCCNTMEGLRWGGGWKEEVVGVLAERLFGARVALGNGQ